MVYQFLVCLGECIANKSFCWATPLIFTYFKLYVIGSRFILLGDDLKNDIKSNLKAVGCPYNIFAIIAPVVISSCAGNYCNSQVSCLALTPRNLNVPSRTLKASHQEGSLLIRNNLCAILSNWVLPTNSGEQARTRGITYFVWGSFLWDTSNQ